MLKQVKIDGLFGVYNYEIVVPDRGDLFILTGPNGYGKTTVLNIIDRLSCNDLLYFKTLPFDRIVAVFDNYTLDIESIDKTENGTEHQEDAVVSEGTLVFTIRNNDGSVIGNFSIPKDSNGSNVESSNDWKLIKDIYSYQLDKFVSSRGIIKKDEREAEKLQSLKKVLAAQKKENLLTFLMAEKTPARLIPSQRLYSTSDADNTDNNEAITELSEKLKKALKKCQLHFLERSQDIDSTFISRLMESDKEINEEDYFGEKEELEKLKNHINEYGLYPKFAFPEYNNKKSDILYCYVTETAKKLEAYKPLLNNLDLFSELIRKKGFSNKEFSITESGGLRFTTLGQVSTIPLIKLSSGEKNEIILLYNLIFELHEGEILMIDEPEISLHVEWQLNFLEDIEKIAKTNKIRVIVATHSPQLIGDRWDKCYDLYDVTTQTETLKDE